MTTRLAALSCCLSLVLASVVAAQDLSGRRSAPLTEAAVDTALLVGARRPTSLVNAARALLREEGSRAVPPRQDCGRDRGNWMERHPVWAAGALVWGSVGSGVGALAGWGIGCNRDDDVCRG